MPERDFAVVGAGIVGLAVARELLLRRPGAGVLVAEKEDRLAVHQSGSNSGVLHSGLYYAPGSLKATLCRAGRERMLAFAAEHGIPVRMDGKLVVATTEAELPALAELQRRGVANGLQGLRELGGEEIREIEPHVRGVRALHVPETAVIDFAEVTRTLAREVERLGGEVRLNTEITDLRELGARQVVTCGGLASDRLAALTGEPAHRISPFRGDFFVLDEPAASWVNGLVYPVPDPRFPFLGVHFTKRIDGAVWAGPNAVPVLSRRLLAPEMRRLMRRYWRTGAAELYRAASVRAALRDMQRYLPELRREHLRRGPSGVRAQVVDREGRLVDDFVIEQAPGALHVVNAPSPAATASLAIAEHVAGLVLGVER
jgi:2-hydroxyglutarate dehydrogenase/L-2-hydroxyglutarate oxidase